MSKHHQSSRRKSYGRRQHEVRERQDRASISPRASMSSSAMATRRAGRPASPSSTRALRASASCRRLTDGRLRGRPPTNDHARRGRPRIAEGPTLERRRARAAVRAGRRPIAVGLVLGAIVVAFMLAFFSLAQVCACPPPARHRAPPGHPGPARLPAAGPPLGPEPPRARAGDPQARHRRRPGPVERSAHPAGPLGDRANHAGSDRFPLAGCWSCCWCSWWLRSP